MPFEELGEKLLNPYDRPARLYPGLLVLAPLAVLIVCIYSENRIVTSGALTVVASCGGAYALTRVARDSGARIQNALFSKWGGAPTTQMLRHSDPYLDVHSKQRFHGVLSKGIGKRLPTAELEGADPAAADELYRAATVWLINQTRDPKAFPLVFKDNVAFGFHRNSFGLRPLGLSIAGLCFLWALVHAGIVGLKTPVIFPERLRDAEPAVLVTLAFSVVMFLVWGVFLNEAAVRRAGISFAERLIHSCDRLKSPARAAGKKAGPSIERE